MIAPGGACIVMDERVADEFVGLRGVPAPEEADNVLFTTMTMNTQALHLDAATGTLRAAAGGAATHAPHGGPGAAGPPLGIIVSRSPPCVAPAPRPPAG